MLLYYIARSTACNLTFICIYLSFQSAAALCIGVGSFSDPDDIPGLAHFLEHSKDFFALNYNVPCTAPKDSVYTGNSHYFKGICVCHKNFII